MADSKTDKSKAYDERTRMNTINPSLTNETMVIAKIRARMTGMNSDGNNTVAVSDTATAIGADTKALKFASTAQGVSTVAAGVASSSQGISSVATGTASTAQGFNTNATGLVATTQGIATNALQTAALAEGESTVASGEGAHAEGGFTVASGLFSHAEGYLSAASDSTSHAEGYQTIARAGSHSEGFQTEASGTYSHAEGGNTVASREYAHAEGLDSVASGAYSHAEGNTTTAGGEASHAEGNISKANGNYSHTEGDTTTANGAASHTEGQNTIAQGAASHAEGSLSVANGNYSHAEGYTTNASGLASHAEGNVTIASGLYTHAEGNNTTTAAQEGAHIMGKFGDATFPYSWHLANGTDANNRSLAAVIRNNGQGIADQGWVTGNADFAEMFETMSGENIPPGYFVTLEGDKIRKANSDDDYIQGVTSATPGFLGDAVDLRWKGKYMTDEWGRTKYRKVMVHEQKDKNGNAISHGRTEMRPVINLEWNSSMEYTPRSDRPEWVPVAAMGKVLVRDDGTCRVNGYCMPGNDGIATASKKGYRILKRTGPRQILIFIYVMAR